MVRLRTSPSGLAGWSTRWLTALLLLMAAGRCAYLARADHLSRGSLLADRRTATVMEAGSPVFQKRLADQLEAEGGNARVPLEHAAALDPWNASRWIDLATSVEMAGQIDAAESYLLKAQGVSRTYQPRWALAQFYARRGDECRFWKWAVPALATVPDNPKPLFRLCWNMSADGAWILKKAVPNRRNIRRDYLLFLLEQGDIPTADFLAEELAEDARPDPADTGPLLAFCDRRLAGHQPSASLRVWNGLCRAGAIPYPPLPVSPARLVNPDFAREPLGAGFDWRPEPHAEIEAVPGAGGLRLSFTGRQPEMCGLVSQYVAIPPGHRYLLRHRYDGPPEAHDALWWRVLTPQGEEVPTERIPKSGAIRFRTNQPLVRVALFHRRAPGTVRFEGTVTIRSVQVEEVQ